MKTLKFTIGITLALILNILAISAQQQEPLPPKDFSAIVEKTSAGIALKISWTANEDGVTPNIFMIYATFGDQERLMTLGKVKHESDRKEYVYYAHNLAPGVYHIYMKAALHPNGALIESEKTETISVSLENTNAVFQFVSKPPTTAVIGGKYIYAMKVHSSYNCHIGFELIEHPEGMYIEGNTIYWEPKSEGDFKVAVKAFLIDCDTKAETHQSFSIRVTDKNTDKPFVRIMMESNSGINMKLGETLTYRFKYETNINCPVIFEFLNELPEGFHLDKMGTFTFTPHKEGMYKFTVKAYLECHPDVHHLLTFVIIVGQGHQDPPKHCAYIKGTVSDEDGNLVSEGVVSAWKLDRNNNSHVKEMALYKSEIKEGHYSINLPEGNYALDITGKTFYPEWYMDAQYVTDAERITVECDDEIEINVIVKMLPVPNKYTISGKVYDAVTNEPIYAQVEFIPVKNLFQDSRNKEGHSFVTKTDENGYYSITLQDNHEYIARAVSMMNNNRYMVLYYESAANPMEADIIELTGNLSDINFAMKKVEDEQKGGFTGRVINKDNEPLQAKLIAYCIKTDNHNFTGANTAFTAETDEEGYFRFVNLIPGDYVVMSMPLDRNYVPGYYKQNDYSVLKWRDATVIAVDEAMIDMIYEVKHRLRGEIGLVEIGGKIINSGGGRIEKQGSKLQNTIPVAGALVYIIDEFGLISDYGYTNSYGEFNLAEVAAGELRLIADKVGFDSYESNVQTDFERNTNIQMEFSMSESPVEVENDNINMFDAVAYPIPTTNSLTLQFSSEEQTVANIVLINSLGQEVYSFTQDVLKGDNIKRMNTTEFLSGIYFVRLTIGSKTQTIPVHIIK